MAYSALIIGLKDITILVIDEASLFLCQFFLGANMGEN
jgi:hypothetical protein